MGTAACARAEIIPVPHPAQLSAAPSSLQAKRGEITIQLPLTSSSSLQPKPHPAPNRLLPQCGRPPIAWVHQAGCTGKKPLQSQALTSNRGGKSQTHGTEQHPWGSKATGMGRWKGSRPVPSQGAACRHPASLMSLLE